MSDTAQQQIDILIQSIADAEEPASITNGMVATVLEFLADRIKAAFAAQAGFLDSSDLATALATYFVNGKLSDDVLPAALVSTIASLPENYTRLGRDGKLLSSQAPVMVLASMGSNYDPPGYRYEPKNGDTYFMGSKLMYVKNEESLDMGSPSAGTVYCNAANDMLYRWNGSRFVTVSSPNSGTTSNLTALINNIELVNSKVNALIEALANIAFKQLPKPETTELDWDGTKHTVTLNTNGMSGCSVEGNWPKQILDGMSAVITVVPENGKILRSVTYRYGNDYTWQTVVISNNQAVITIPNVTSDMTVTIQASATAAGSFTASISDNRVSGTGATSGITEGSAWTSVLSLNSTADPSDDITNVTATMEGSDSSISAEKVNGVWTVHTDYVTGRITITVTVEGVVKRTVSLVNSNTNDGDAVLKMFRDSAKTSEISNPQINDGGSFTCYLGTSSADVDIAWGLTDGEAWPYPVKVVMGSQDITQAAFDKDAMKVEIPQVTDNVVITAQTMTWASSKSVNTDGSLGVDTLHSATDYIDLSGVSKLVMHHRDTNTNKNAAFYNSEKTRVNYYSMNANYRTCQTQEGWSYTRMTCQTSHRKYFFVRAEKNGKWVYLYRGIDYDGRNEDEYNVEYGAGLTKSGGNASITLPAAHVLTDFIAVGDYDMLYFNIGQNIDAYNANTYDSNKTRISGFTQSSSVPREVDNASKSIKYIRMTSNIFDSAYVYGKKTVDGVDVYEWIMRGIAVSDSTLPSGNETTE